MLTGQHTISMFHTLSFPVKATVQINHPNDSKTRKLMMDHEFFICHKACSWPGALPWPGASWLGATVRLCAAQEEKRRQEEERRPHRPPPVVSLSPHVRKETGNSWDCCFDALVFWPFQFVIIDRCDKKKVGQNFCLCGFFFFLKIVTKLRNTNCDKAQKLKLWQNSETQITTKLQNSNCDNSKTQIVTKFKKSNCDKKKLKNSNCNKT